MKRVLMVAYHFPPLAGSSGIQRTLRFVQHLPALGWQPLVLTAHPRAYERTSHDLDADVPSDAVVCRAQAWDTARHFAISGRYVGAIARPDRWVSWRFDAVRQGMQLIRKYKPQALFSTYPIATAHLIGAELQCRSGLPWVADFRDPMAQEGYPADPLTWQQYRTIEQRVLRSAAACTFTTPGAAAEYKRRYPNDAHKVRVIENGYDEESFDTVEAAWADGARLPLNPGAITLLHSGIVYPSERDPTQFMAALKQLHDAGDIAPQHLRVRFRAAVAEDLLRGLAAQHGVAQYLEICPPIPYREALAEMLRADALLLMQAGNCNAQIPAKVYEYLRARRPLLCLSDPAGDTMGLVRAAGVETVARLDDAADIANLLRRFLTEGGREHALPNASAVSAASRHGRSEQLAALLIELTQSQPSPGAAARRAHR